MSEMKKFMKKFIKFMKNLKKFIKKFIKMFKKYDIFKQKNGDECCNMELSYYRRVIWNKDDIIWSS